MALDSLYKADLLSDLIGQISADMGSEKVKNRQAHNDALLALIGGASIASFLDIGDVPNSYAGMSGWLLSVTPSEDGIGFIDPSTFLSAVSTDNTLTGDGTPGNPLKAVASGSTFISLADTPASYPGVGKILQVNATNDGLEFVTSGAAANIYVASGLLSGNRLMNGNGYSFTINNASSITLQSAGSGIRIEDTVGSAYMTLMSDILMTPQISTTSFKLSADIQFLSHRHFSIDLSGGTGNLSIIGSNSGWMNIMSNSNPDVNITSPINGVLSYDSTDHQFRGYVNGGWIDLATGPTLYNGDGQIGSGRTITMIDSVMWEGISKFKYISGANEIKSGTGYDIIGNTLIGNLTQLTTASGKTDGWYGMSITTGSHPQGSGHSEYREEISNGIKRAGTYIGPFSATEAYASLYYTLDGNLPSYKGFQADPQGERLYSQYTTLDITLMPATLGIMFIENGGYMRAASLSDLADRLTIPLSKVLVDGNESDGTDIVMGSDSIEFGGTPGSNGSIYANLSELIIDGFAYDITTKSRTGKKINFQGQGGADVGVIRLSKDGGTTYTTLDVTSTINRNISLPDNDGIIALMSDLPAISGNGIYDGSGTLTSATTVTLSAANSITWSGGLSKFKGSDDIHGTLVISVTDSNNSKLFEITNGGSVKVNNPNHHEIGAFSFHTGNAKANVTNGSAFSLEALDNTVLFDISAAGGHRMLGTLAISDSTLKAQLSVITNSSTTAGIFNNVGVNATGYAIRAIAEDNIAVVIETNGNGASNTSLYTNSNVVFGGTQPVGGVSGTTRLLVNGSTSGTEWGIQTKDGSGVTGFSINNDGVGVLRNYTVATVPTSIAGGLIYVTNESGGATPCYGDGSTWRRIYDKAVIS